MTARYAVADLIRSWIGFNEKDGSHKTIIDVYNSHKPLPRGYKMPYTASWCAATVSAVAIKLGYTNIIPVECSCGEMIKLAQKMGIWEENDGYVPEQGDIVMYDWNDKGVGDNVGWPDHVGIIDTVSSGYMTVIEGNYNDSVKKRTISLNGKFIRGFITPRYDANLISVPSVTTPGKDVKTIAMEVISGIWGSGETRKKSLENAGYNYAEVRNKVNEILNGSAAKPVEVVPSPAVPSKPTGLVVKSTCVAKGFTKVIAGEYSATANVYCRNDAGTNKKALVKIPKGSRVRCYGYYNTFSGAKWYLIAFDSKEGVHYEGFTHSAYLKR